MSVNLVAMGSVFGTVFSVTVRHSLAFDFGWCVVGGPVSSLKLK